MIIKVNDTPKCNIALELSVDCEAEVIELLVTTRDKKNNTVEKKQFAADAFPAALSYFRKKEAEGIERKE